MTFSLHNLIRDVEIILAEPTKEKSSGKKIVPLGNRIISSLICSLPLIVEISNVKVGVGSTQKIISKTVSVTISEDNFEDHIYKEQSATGVNGDNINYATTVTDVTWED